MAQSPLGPNTHLDPTTTITALAAPLGRPPSPPPPHRPHLPVPSGRTVEFAGRASVKTPGWPTNGRVRVEVGNWITQRMTRLPSREIRIGEPEPNLLGLGLASSCVGDGGFGLWNRVVGRSLIMRSAISLVKGSSAGDPLSSSSSSSSSSIAGVLLGAAIVKGVMPSGGPASRPRSTCDLGV
jgi:hypothetical protein